MGGGGGPPPPSDEEKELQREQAVLLREQNAMLKEDRRMQELLQPLLLEEVGLSADRDADGNITGFRRAERPEDALRREIEVKALERTKAALAGELPVDPALMKDLAERERTLEDELIKDFGSVSAARTSTPGQQRMREFDIYKENVLGAARRGDMTLAQQLAQGQGADNMNRFINAPSSVVSTPFNTQGFNSLNQTLNQTLSGMRGERLAIGQMNAEEVASRNQTWGTVAGAGMTAAAIYF